MCAESALAVVVIFAAVWAVCGKVGGLQAAAYCTFKGGGVGALDVVAAGKQPLGDVRGGAGQGGAAEEGGAFFDGGLYGLQTVQAQLLCGLGKYGGLQGGALKAAGAGYKGEQGLLLAVFALALVLWVVKDELRLLGAVAVQRLHGGQVLAGGGGAPCVYGGDGVVVQGCGLLCPVAGCGLVGVVAGVVIGCGVCVEPVLHQAGCFPCGAGKDDVVGADGVGQVVAVYAPVWGVAVVAGCGCDGGCGGGWRFVAYGKHALPCEHGCASLLQPVVRWLGQDLPYGGAGDECVCVVGVQQQCIAQYAQKYGGAGVCGFAVKGGNA